MKEDNIFSEQRHKTLYLIGIILLQFFFLKYFWGQIGDDAYIFFRYAINLADHGELAWNLGERSVEGFSSPLWVLFLSMISPFVDVVLGAKILGAIFSYLSLLRVWQISERNIVSVLGASLGIGFQYWAISGLETSLYCFLLLSSVLSIRGRASIFWLALLGLVRPESPLLLLVGVLLLRPQWQKAAALLLPTGLYLLFRVWYFGEILPNTYFAKATGEPLLQILRGLQYSLIPLVAIFFLLQDEILRRKEVVLPLLLLAIVIGGGGDWMWYERLLVPIYLVLWGWNGLLCGFPRIAMLIVLLTSSIPQKYWSGIVQGERLSSLEYQEGTLVEMSQMLADEIRQNIPKGSKIAINHAGAVPYFLLEYSFVDMTGLNNHWIARVDGDLHQKYDSEYVLSQKPDLIVMNSLQNPQEGFVADYWEGETNLFNNTGFQEQYVPVARAWKRARYLGSPAYMTLFQRKVSENTKSKK